jgi:hypothetical protein
LRRIVKDKDLEDVSTEALIKFVGSCLPKDMSLSVTRPTQVTYISNIPRAELEDKVRETITREVGEDDLGEDQNHPDR